MDLNIIILAIIVTSVATFISRFSGAICANAEITKHFIPQPLIQMTYIVIFCFASGLLQHCNFYILYSSSWEMIRFGAAIQSSNDPTIALI